MVSYRDRLITHVILHELGWALGFSLRLTSPPFWEGTDSQRAEPATLPCQCTAQWPVPRYRQLKRSRGGARPACPRRPPGPQLAPTAWRETRQRRRHGADAPHGATCSPSAAQRASCKAHATSCPPSRRENPAARQHEGQGEDHADNPPARSLSLASSECVHHHPYILFHAEPETVPAQFLVAHRPSSTSVTKDVPANLQGYLG